MLGLSSSDRLAGSAPGKRSLSDLTRLVVRAEVPSAVLPDLHQALEAVGAARSALLQRDAASGNLHATSARGVEPRGLEGWTPAPAEIARIERLFDSDGVLDVPDLREMLPSVASALAMTSAVLVPLETSERRIGILAIECRGAASGEAARRIGTIADLFVLAIERTQRKRDADLQHEIRQLLDLFSRTVSSSLAMTAGLEAFCCGANRLFAARRTSVWLHDRRAYQVVLEAASDADYTAERHAVPSSDTLVPAAIGLRRERAVILGHPNAQGGNSLTVPLRGRRRALGTLVFEGLRIAGSSRVDLLERADEVGRQLSFAIENVELLEEVLRSRREIENTFNSIADLVAVFDRDLRLVHVNGAFVDRIGQSRDAILGRSLADFVSADTERWVRGLDLAPSSAASDRTQAAAIQIEHPALGGTFSMSVTALVGDERAPLGSVLVARDVTRQAQLEAEQAELRTRLSQSEKLAALGQFVAGIAHELNNPLQAVLGHLELLRVTGAFPPSVRRDVRVVYREADRAAKIVRNLLVFAGSRRLVRRPISLNAVVTRALALRSAACRAAAIDLVREYSAALPRIHADPLRLQQALLNILINAEQAVDGHPCRRITAETSLGDSGERVILRIRDTGPGLPPEVMSRIFEPFFTTKDVGRGTGLGLAIAYGIIQEHGGQIAAGNHPEGGAIFTIELPVRPRPRPGLTP